MAATETGGGPPVKGVPSGGTTGQVLAKASNTNYDVSWQTAAGGPAAWAIVQADGTVTASSGVDNVAKTNTGEYVVTFLASYPDASRGVSVSGVTGPNAVAFVSYSNTDDTSITIRTAQLTVGPVDINAADNAFIVMVWDLA